MEAVLLTGTDGRILLANRACAVLFGDAIRRLVFGRRIVLAHGLID